MWKAARGLYEYEHFAMRSSVETTGDMTRGYLLSLYELAKSSVLLVNCHIGMHITHCLLLVANSGASWSLDTCIRTSWRVKLERIACVVRI